MGKFYALRRRFALRDARYDEEMACTLFYLESSSSS